MHVYTRRVFRVHIFIYIIYIIHTYICVCIRIREEPKHFISTTCSITVFSSGKWKFSICNKPSISIYTDESLKLNQSFNSRSLKQTFTFYDSVATLYIIYTSRFPHFYFRNLIKLWRVALCCYTYFLCNKWWWWWYLNLNVLCRFIIWINIVVFKHRYTIFRYFIYSTYISDSARSVKQIKWIISCKYVYVLSHILFM